MIMIIWVNIFAAVLTLLLPWRLLGIDGFLQHVAIPAVFAVVLLMAVVTVPMYIKILRQSPKDGEGLT